jgi:hypothetical protein
MIANGEVEVTWTEAPPNGAGPKRVAFAVLGLPPTTTVGVTVIP